MLIYYSVRYNLSSSKDENLVVSPGDVGSSLLRSVEIHSAISQILLLLLSLALRNAILVHFKVLKHTMRHNLNIISNLSEDKCIKIMTQLIPTQKFCEVTSARRTNSDVTAANVFYVSVSSLFLAPALKSRFKWCHFA